jgi:RecA-family ATPase
MEKRGAIRRHVSATIASGAVGKSSLKIVEALALATGRPLLGVEVPKRSRVWLFNLGDEKNEMNRRMIAAMIHYRIKPEDVEGYLFVESETSLVITATDRNGTKIRIPVVGGLIDAIKRRAVDALKRELTSPSAARIRTLTDSSLQLILACPRLRSVGLSLHRRRSLIQGVQQ